MSMFSGSSAAAPAGADARSADPALPPELAQAMSKLTEISSLPEVTTRIVAVVEDPKSTAQDMHNIVKNDPALASKVLKVVNSAFYGLPAQISSLDRAIVMLGLSAVKNIALAASLSRLFRPEDVSGAFNARDLWTHSIAVGVCARLLAEKSVGHAEEAFVAGLVHDMGLLAEYQLFPEKLAEVVERCSVGDLDFCEQERAIVGADHQAFGAALATKWKFPPVLRYAISYHHNPERLKPEFRKAVTLVQVADIICCQNELGFSLTARNHEVTVEMLEQIGLDEERVAASLEVLPERIEETEAIFRD